MKLSAKIFLGFALVILLSTIDSIVNYQLSQQVNRNTEFLTKSELIIRNSNRLQRGITEMQSSFRGYLLSENDNFLKPYYGGLTELPELFKEQTLLVKGNSLQTIRLDSIKAIHDQWINYANDLIVAKKKELALIEQGVNYSELFQSKLVKEVGKKMNDEITGIFQEFDKHEYRIRQERRDALTTSITHTRTTSVILSMATIIIALVSALYVTKLISKRIETMVTHAERISKGEFPVIDDNKNDELTNLSHSLNAMSQRLEKNFTELEKKNKELDQFAYVVSHDLKAPLRGMYNISHWIEEDLGHELSDQFKKYLNLLRGRIERLENLINGLLEYAKVGRTKKSMQDVNVEELLTDIETLILPSEYKIQILSKMPVLHTEKVRLEQIFTNLISNAFKHDSKKEGVIKVNCEDLNTHFKFQVIDHGDGIEAEYHERIFGIFQTLREKHEVESTGVGLAIVKKIVEEEKGTLTVESEVGKGSTFSFTWPKQYQQTV